MQLVKRVGISGQTLGAEFMRESVMMGQQRWIHLCILGACEVVGEQFIEGDSKADLTAVCDSETCEV